MSFDSVHGLLFDQFESVAAAAKASLGVALLPHFLFTEEIRRGDLVPLFESPLLSDEGYHLVWPLQRRDSPSLTMLRDWLLKEAKGEPHIADCNGDAPYPRGRMPKA